MGRPQPSSEEPEEGREYDRFERLTKRLLGVPKEEIDRKVKEEDDARKRRAT